MCNGTNDGDNESMIDASDIDFSSSHLSLATVATSSNDQYTTTTTTTNTPQHSNIILIRGARTENGQIILQNSQELLNLLNGTGTVSISCEDEKLIQLPHSGFKTTTITNKTTKDATGTGHIMIQSPIKPNTSAHQIVDISANGIKTTAAGGHQTVVRLPALNAPTAKKSNNMTNAVPGGSIFLQQRLNKNTTSDVPILLQTLKRLDKSQSILLFRNAQSTSSTLTTSSMKTTTANATNHIAVLNNNANAKENTSGSGASTNKTVSSNVPLGTGEYNSLFLSFIFLGLLRIIVCPQS